VVPCRTVSWRSRALEEPWCHTAVVPCLEESRLGRVVVTWRGAPWRSRDAPRLRTASTWHAASQTPSSVLRSALMVMCVVLSWWCRCYAFAGGSALVVLCVHVEERMIRMSKDKNERRFFWCCAPTLQGIRMKIFSRALRPLHPRFTFQFFLPPRPLRLVIWCWLS
jgi:hypothetical protein